MAVSRRQGREKSTKIEQRGRSREGPRTAGRTSGRTALLPKPNLHGVYIKRIKRGAQGLSRSPPQHGAVFSSSLWIPVPSRLEDGFSCYLLNKIEPWRWAVTLLSLSAMTRSVQDPRAWPAEGASVCVTPILAVTRQRTEEHTLAWHIYTYILNKVSYYSVINIFVMLSKILINFKVQFKCISHIYYDPSNMLYSCNAE